MISCIAGCAGTTCHDLGPFVQLETPELYSVSSDESNTRFPLIATAVTGRDSLGVKEHTDECITIAPAGDPLAPRATPPALISTRGADSVSRGLTVELRAGERILNPFDGRAQIRVADSVELSHLGVHALAGLSQPMTLDLMAFARNAKKTGRPLYIVKELLFADLDRDGGVRSKLGIDEDLSLEGSAGDRIQGLKLVVGLGLAIVERTESVYPDQCLLVSNARQSSATITLRDNIPIGRGGDVTFKATCRDTLEVYSQGLSLDLPQQGQWTVDIFFADQASAFAITAVVNVGLSDAHILSGAGVSVTYRALGAQELMRAMPPQPPTVIDEPAAPHTGDSAPSSENKIVGLSQLTVTFHGTQITVHDGARSAEHIIRVTELPARKVISEDTHPVNIPFSDRQRTDWDAEKKTTSILSVPLEGDNWDSLRVECFGRYEPKNVQSSTPDHAVPICVFEVSRSDIYQAWESEKRSTSEAAVARRPIDLSALRDLHIDDGVKATYSIRASVTPEVQTIRGLGS